MNGPVKLFSVLLKSGTFIHSSELSVYQELPICKTLF